MENGILLFNRWEERSGTKSARRLVLPAKYREKVLKHLHDVSTASHLGQKKTWRKVTQRYYWPGVRKFVQWWVATCQMCQSFKNPQRKPRAELKQYQVGVPFERIAMDIIGPLPQTDSGNLYILVICDYFTKYVEAIPLPDQKAETVTRAFMTNWVSRLGCPRELHTDRGSNFLSEVFLNLCVLLDIKKTHTTARHAQSDGLVENFNKTLEKMLAMCVSKNQFDWDLWVPYTLLAYRSCVHDSTQETPFLMTYGREVALPLDVATPPLPDEVPLAAPEYILKVQSRMREAHEDARECLEAAGVRQKRGYMTRFNGRSFKPGDLVWYWRPPAKKGKSPKLAAAWEGPFFVIKAWTDVVYIIQKTRKSKSFPAHHDNLKPCKSRGEIDVGWITEATLPEPSEPRDEPGVIQPTADQEPIAAPRPARERKAPARYGEWYLEPR